MIQSIFLFQNSSREIRNKHGLHILVDTVVFEKLPKRRIFEERFPISNMIEKHN